uniref:Mobile element protein n=1 Tax=uncultured bacterium contig00008 TaxID=1181500 RepID=A0A806KGC1_9BACT|nr:mobile element protein [uncultured bacterium contig00008]
MKANKGRYAIKEMAMLFGVSRSAYYKWTKNGVSQRRKNNRAELVRLIREIVIKHHRRYGSPRVRLELRKAGKHVSLKKVAQIMRENGLNARKRRKYIPTTDSKHSLPVCENILNQEFHAEKSGEKWVSDITYLRTLNGWIYLTVVLDLYDRKVVGWALSDGMEAINTAIGALEMAFKNRIPRQGLIFHSDRGVQYCAQSFRDVLREHCPTVRQSMSRKGNCWDNACAESFFKTLKRELETLNGKHPAEEVRQSVFMYIEAYYNRIRMHSVLDYVAPNAYNLSNVA